MSAGFKVDGEVFWGTNGAVEAYVEALAEQTAALFGPEDPLAVVFRDARDGFFTGYVVFLDEILTTPLLRRRFLAALDAVTAQILQNGTFTEYGVTWIETTMREFRARIAAGLEDLA